MLCQGFALRTDQGFLIDVRAEMAAKLVGHLNRYKLRAKVTVEQSDDYSVWALLGSASDHSPSGSVFEDPRLGGLLGHRLITAKGEQPAGVPVADSELYELCRLAVGLAEHPDDTPAGSALPLESNLELLNGISWRKGCYMGQELTSRTFHTGKTRKRLLPVLCGPPGGGVPASTQIPLLLPVAQMLRVDATLADVTIRGTAPAAGSQIVLKETGKKVGVMRSSMHNLGLAQLRLQQALKPGAELIVEDDGTEIRVCPASWLDQTLQDAA